MGKILNVLIVSCLISAAFSVPCAFAAMPQFQNEIEEGGEFIQRHTKEGEVFIQKQTWQLGGEASYIKYEEPSLSMKEDGVMYGAAGSYSYRDWANPDVGNVMLKGEGKFSYGQVDYTGSGTLDNLDDYMVEARGIGGYDFYAGEAGTMTPYFGFGYRYLYDDLRGITSTGAAGYRRESNYFYSPVGLTVLMDFKNNWSIDLTGEYDIFWKGIQKSRLSDANPSFSDLENDQNDGYGVRGAIKISKSGEKFDLVFEPFIRYWNIKQSELSSVTFSGTIVGVGYEPANHSTEYGIRVTARF